jgi:hypothetical protein
MEIAGYAFFQTGYTVLSNWPMLTFPFSANSPPD